MTSDELHRRADVLARERQIPHSAALSIMARAGARARRRRYGVTHVTVGDRSDFAAIEQPARPYWWQRDGG
jgi:hypothetical protein